MIRPIREPKPRSHRSRVGSVVTVVKGLRVDTSLCPFVQRLELQTRNSDIPSWLGCIHCRRGAMLLRCGVYDNNSNNNNHNQSPINSTKHSIKFAITHLQHTCIYTIVSHQGKQERQVFLSNKHRICHTRTLFVPLTTRLLTTWFMKPEDSMPHSQGLSNNSYPKPNQPNSPQWYPSLQGPF